MKADKQTYNRATVMRQWVQRRLLKGIRPSADEVWAHIRETWPMASEEQMEYIFQHSEPKEHTRGSAKQKKDGLPAVHQAIKKMASESPPPDFKPAIPLREAIDTINAYVAEEGDALELSVSKRGRLKVRYEYGG